MDRKLIENSDRGITLNKSLAWTILCGLLGTGVFYGVNMASTSTKLDEIARSSTAATAERQAIESRVRSLEQSKARDDERFTSILTFMGKIDSRLERIEQRGNP